MWYNLKSMIFIKEMRGKANIEINVRQQNRKGHKEDQRMSYRKDTRNPFSREAIRSNNDSGDTKRLERKRRDGQKFSAQVFAGKIERPNTSDKSSEASKRRVFRH
jgi:hypothetical protein